MIVHTKNIVYVNKLLPALANFLRKKNKKFDQISNIQKMSNF